MRVMVALENRFLKTHSGRVYSTTVCDYSLWKRYLQVFDEVIVLARVERAVVEHFDKPIANGPGVKFFELPMYIGPWQYLTKHFKIKSLITKAIGLSDAYILRVPGRVGTLLWQGLMRKQIPYGVEVVTSAADSAMTCGANGLMRLILSRKGLDIQKLQCRHAVAATYVTKSYLQAISPSDGWVTFCSNVELPEEAIIDERELSERLTSLKEAVNGRQPFRICHVGSMAARYKAQDILMEAVSICWSKGYNIKLRLLGEGKYYQQFRNKSKSLGISQHVRFVGTVPSGGAVREHLDAAHLFVLPSLVEGLPRSLVEAMARGLPCVGSNVGGIPELLDREDLVPPGNVRALAEKIGQVIRDENRLMRMSTRNLQMAEEYLVKKLNPRRVEFYKKVAEITEKWHRDKTQQ